jgi:predicted anti-sigma-YlaC factor YlaD
MNEHISTDLLLDYLHGELAPEDDALAHAHLATCAACRREYDVEASLAEALRAEAKADEREMPSMISAEIWQRVRDARPGPLAQFAAWFRPALALPVAAALVIGGWFATVPHAGSKPTVDVMYYLQTHASQSGTPLSLQSGPPALETSMLDESTVPLIAEHVGSSLAAGGLDEPQ